MSLIGKIYYQFQEKASDLLHSDYHLGMINLNRFINFIDSNSLIYEFIQKQLLLYPMEYNPMEYKGDLRIVSDTIIKEGIDAKEVSFFYWLLKSAIETNLQNKDWDYWQFATILIDLTQLTSPKCQDHVDHFHKNYIRPYFINHIDSYLKFLMDNQKMETNSARIINTEKYYEQSGNIGIAEMSGGQILDNVNIAGVINESEQKSLADVAKEIQELLEQLSQTYPIEKASEKLDVVTRAVDKIENNSLLKSRIIRVLKAVGSESFKQAIDHPLIHILMSGLEALEP